MIREVRMIKTPVFKGSCTALVTPFNEEGGIDYERLSKNLSYQYENGTAAVVICGTTGECATITSNEYEQLVRFTVRETAGRMKVIAGVGSNNTMSALEKAQSAYYLGADAILMVTPYYNKTSQTGLIEHFSYVADRVDLPMILYNVPSRTGIGIKCETYRKLSEHSNIVGVKEASGDVGLVGDTMNLCGDDLYIWSGNDNNTVALMAMGALGVISVASNIIPGAVATLCRSCLDGNYTEAAKLADKYAGLCAALFTEPNPMPVKAAMKMLGMDSGVLRLPLTDISSENFLKLKNVMIAAGLAIQ